MSGIDNCSWFWLYCLTHLICFLTQTFIIWLSTILNYVRTWWRLNEKHAMCTNVRYLRFIASYAFIQLYWLNFGSISGIFLTRTIPQTINHIGKNVTLEWAKTITKYVLSSSWYCKIILEYSAFIPGQTWKANFWRDD